VPCCWQVKDRDFHTSGSREADQRAEQRIAKTQQLRGEGDKSEGEGIAGKANVKKSLYERLGGEKGIRGIMDDFVTRAVADPRVNWERKGIKRGGVMGVGGKPVEWKPTPQNVEQLSKHLTQFVSLATGGPAHYDGRDMKEAHKGMKITNAEYDAAIGDLKAALDAARVPTEEQKELLSIVESTRPQVTEERD
jgi:hemoglobin